MNMQLRRVDTFPSVSLASHSGGPRPVRELPAPPDDSLLREHLPEARDHHDSFELRITRDELPAVPAETVLAAVLEGFLARPPVAGAWMMAVRSLLVLPLRLRPSPLGTLAARRAQGDPCHA